MLSSLASTLMSYWGLLLSIVIEYYLYIYIILRTLFLLSTPYVPAQFDDVTNNLADGKIYLDCATV